MADSIISASDLGKTVKDSSGSLTILQGITFELNKGKTMAIVGASGSGKSTLLSLLAGLDIPTKGTVKIAEKDIFALTEDERAAHRAIHMGFVFQSFQLLSNLTALENVMLPLELLGRKNAADLAKSMLSRVGLAERLAHMPKLLSGGEQQRVALARAFVVSPSILLADEPTGSLDFETGNRVMDLMFELNREAGTTLILVTHDLEIAKRCEVKLELVAGKMINSAIK